MKTDHGHGAGEAVPIKPRRVRARLNIARALCRPSMFRLWESLGVHVTPVHFYQPIPDTRRIPDKLWHAPTLPPGLRIDLDAMSRALHDMSARFADELRGLPENREQARHGFYLRNRMYQSVDAELLYMLIRSRKPRRMIEIGSGFSTLLACCAIEANTRDDPAYTCELTSIDPYPSETLRHAPPRMIRQIATPVQNVPLDTFAALERDDILFIDSSHVCTIGSDVQYELLELTPRVAPGVLVHFHDIFLPAEYPREWVKRRHLFWNEQYLLQAFLSYNDAFRVVWAGQWMHLQRPEALRACIPSYDPMTVMPGSFWIERVA